MSRSHDQEPKQKLSQLGRFWLEKRPVSPNWYRVHYEPSMGQNVRVSLRTTSFDEAQKKLIAFVSSDLPSNRRSPDVVRLHQVIDWHYENHGKNIISWKNERYANDRWKSYFAESTTISELLPLRVNKFVEELKQQGLSLGTISKILTTGRSALHAARDNQKVSSVPKIKDCQTQDDKDAVEPMGRELSVEELAKLFVHYDEAHIEDYLFISLYTLCRPAAAWELTRVQVDYETNLINLNQPGRVQNNKRRAHLPLLPGLRTALQAIEKRASERAEATGDKKFVFSRYITWRGKPIKNINRGFRRLVERAGLGGTHVTLYSIRHTMARELRDKGVPDAQISLFLGHRPKGVNPVTLKYAPYKPKYLWHARKVLEAYAERLTAEIERQLAAGKVPEPPLEYDGRLDDRSAAGKR